MRKNLLYPLIFIFTFSFSLNSFAWNPFKKQTYDECILENIKGVKNDDAVREIKFACELKMLRERGANAKKCVKRLLTPAESKLITGSAVLESYGFLKLKVYNGNKNITISQVKVKIVDLETSKSFDFDMTNATVDPISTSGEMLAELLYVPKKWSWYMFDIATEVCN